MLLFFPWEMEEEMMMEMLGWGFRIEELKNWMIVLEDGSEELLERGWGMIS